MMNQINVPLRWIPKYEFGSRRPSEFREQAYPAVYRWGVFRKDGTLEAVYIGESSNVCKRVRRYRVPRSVWKPPWPTTKRVSKFLNDEKKKIVRFELLDFDPFYIKFRGGRTQVHPKGLSKQSTRRFLENLALLSIDRTKVHVLNDDPDFFESRGRWAEREKKKR